MSTHQAIVDTGTSYVLLPTSDYEFVIKYITSSKICGPDKLNNNITFCICSDEQYSTFPDFKIQIDNYVYRLPKESYIQRVILYHT